MYRVSAILLCSCLFACSTQGVGDETSTSQPITTPTLGSGAYPLPLNQGWATLSEGYTFNPGNNSLTIAGGATGNGGGGGGYWNTSVPLQVGQSIAAVQLTVQDNAGARIFAYIAASDPTSGTVTQWCQGHSDGTGNFQTFSFACTGTVPVGTPTLQVTSQGPTATVFAVQIRPSVVHSVTLLPALSYNPGTWGPIDRWTDANQVTMIATTSVMSNGSGRINIPHGDGDTLVGVTVFVSGNGTSDAAFQVERFNITLPGGVSTLGAPTIDSNRGNVWMPIAVSLTPVTLVANDVVYLDMAPTPGAPIGYHVGGVVATFD